MSNRKTTGSEKRRELRRQLVLDSATKLFSKYGYHTTTVPMIVEEARISTGSFYQHFRNKQDLFGAVLEALDRDLATAMHKAKASELGALERVLKSIEALFLFLARNSKQARILIVESSGLSPQLEKRRRSIFGHYQATVRHTLESAPELFGLDNIAILERCITGAAFEALHCWLEENHKTRRPATEIAQAVAQFNAQALMKRPFRSGET
jgi:TetR/AcrR family transcriptional regulator, fatty acid metabolism regulator protein